MRAGGGKQKGASFERAVCVALSGWVSGGKSESIFWRSAMSGGRATVRYAKGKGADGQGGDITATDPRGHALLSRFVLECKHVKDLNLRSAVLKGCGHLVEHWQQVSGDADRVGKLPMLIARQNLFPTLVLLRASCTQQYFGQFSQIEIARFYRMDGYRVSMCLLEDLLGLPYDRERFKAGAVQARKASIADRQDQGVERVVGQRKP